MGKLEGINVIRFGITALALLGSTFGAGAQTPAARPPVAPAAQPAATQAGDVDVLSKPTPVKRHVGPLRGTPIINGNPAIRVDSWGQVITSEQP